MKAKLLTLCSALMFFNIGCIESDNGTNQEPEVINNYLEQNYLFNARGWRNVKNKNHFRCSKEPGQYNDNGLFCLRESCEKARGSFDSENMRCKCRKGLAFNGLYSTCLPPKPSHRYTMFEEGSPRTHFQVNSDNIIKLESFVNEISAQDIDFNFPYTFSLSNYYKLVSPNKVTIEDLKVPLSMEINHTSFMGGKPSAPFTVLEILYNYEQLNAYIDTPKQLGANDQISIPNALINSIYSDIKTLQFQRSVRSHSKFGCNQVCVVTDIASVFTESQTYFIIKKHSITEGSVRQSKIYISKSHDIFDSIGMIVLDRAGNANIVYSFSTDIDKASKSFQAYTPAGSFLGQAEVFNSSTFLDGSGQKLDRDDYALAGPETVMVCEYGQNPAIWPKRNKKRVAIGPFENSIWGWLENPNNELKPLIDGVKINLDLGHFTDQEVRLSSMHHLSVMAGVFTSSDSSTVTAASLEACFSKNTERNVLRNGSFPGRIVNLSLSFQDLPMYCQDRIDSIGTDKRLYTIAAGNDGQSDCDRKIKALENVLSVAGVKKNNTWLAPYSVRGKYSVSTAAIVNDDLEGGGGTSFASPTAAGIASEILYNFPQLTNLQVKRALIIGTEFLRLQVISGGITRLEPALLVAQAMAKGETNLKKLVNTVYELESLKMEIQVAYEANDKRLAAELIHEFENLKRTRDSHYNWLRKTLKR